MSEATLFDLAPGAEATDLGALLDRVLAYACDIDHALELAAALGWQINQVRFSGGFFVMLDGPEGECLTSKFHHMPAVTRRRYTACSNFKSLYGALMLATMQAVKAAKVLPAEAEHFKATGQLLAA